MEFTDIKFLTILAILKLICKNSTKEFHIYTSVSILHSHSTKSQDIGICTVNINNRPYSNFTSFFTNFFYLFQYPIQKPTSPLVVVFCPPPLQAPPIYNCSSAVPCLLDKPRHSWICELWQGTTEWIAYFLQFIISGVHVIDMYYN